MGSLAGQHNGGLRTEYPEKFTSADKAFKNIQRGNKIYIGTAAGEPNTWQDL